MALKQLVPVNCPSMTTAQRDALTAANGDIIYNTSIEAHQLRQNGAWGSVPGPDGWIADSATWVFAGGQGFALTGDATARFVKGTKISYNDGALSYGQVASSSYLPAVPLTAVASTVATSLFTKTAHGLANGTAVVPTGLVNTTGITNGQIYYVTGVAANTTFQLAATVSGSAITLGGTADTNITITAATLVSLILSSDYSIANATLTAPRYSYAASPQGFPTWFGWTPTLSGWSADPTNTVYRWCADGTRITIAVRQATAGTSNAAAHSATLPVAAATITNMVWQIACRATDNGTIQTGNMSVSSAGTTVVLSGIIATNNNTASGSSCLLSGQLTYEF